MAGISASELSKINSFQKLVELLRDHLEWPIDEQYEFDDVVFEYEASELGLKPEEVAKIREIHQLRPLATNQPWGIFFISFEDKALSVTVLRRILKNLILKKRAGAQTADRQAWHSNDLIFAANFGKSGSRELAFVHFSDGAESRDLPVMKVLGWNARDTKLHNDYVGEQLAEKLRWPDDTRNIKKWREDWSSAFELRLNETIRTSKDLAMKLAGLATEIRARANELLAAETDRGPMRKMLEAFRKNLIHDLDEDGFADMFAQTIAYGMLAARISRPMGIVADNLADMMPKTNPFLKELFADFLAIGGQDKRKSLDFDELGVRDVVDMLNAAKMEAVLRDFGDQNPKEDPVIHFYELFLKEYDPQKRMQRGVFYTPRPVVNFIVRGVDEVLRTEFGLPLGLADTSTWGEVAARNPHIPIPDHVKPDSPFVQILDPATGTGTFLVEVIDLIHKRMEEHWKGLGKSASEIKTAWNSYVPRHLLPRLTAFELMMAPYTIAHMKVGLKLAETGYAFGSEERARIFLTNALEPARDLDMEFIFMAEALAHEAQAANHAKDEAAETVVVGNPPYSIQSQNLSASARSWIDGYRYCDGEKIVERNALQLEKNLQDDYIKFFSMSQSRVKRNGQGVVGLITSHGYLDGATFRGMRQSLIEDFQGIRIIDLHGNSNKRESVPEGGADENVFEISQGVCIFLGQKTGNRKAHSVVRLDLWGLRSEGEASKYAMLLGGVNSAWRQETINPTSPLYLFASTSTSQDYQAWPRASEILGLYSMGIKTSRDNLVIGYEGSEVISVVSGFIDQNLSDDQACEQFDVAKKKGWNVRRARNEVRNLGDLIGCLKPMLYRPFDFRTLFYHPSLVFSAAAPVMQNFEGRKNIGLVLTRQTKDQWDVQATEVLTGHKSLGAYDANSVFPLFLKEEAGENFRRPNIERAWALGFCRVIGLTYQDGIPRDQHKSFAPSVQRQEAEQRGLLETPWEGRGDLQKSFGPRDLFEYIYGVLHSPIYRSRYAEFLKSDFPRIPTPASRALFAALVRLGQQLVGLHLLRPEEAPILKNPDIRFAGSGEARVEKGYPEFKNGKVMINASRWFEDVPKETWEFHVGGYQVCEKWLKDRAGKGGKNPSPGRVLTEEDILHYRRVVVALTETRRLMTEIDAEIDKHGGWPDAFVTGNGDT